VSVTFSVDGIRPNWETGAGFVNLANGNARDLLAWLDLDADDLAGSLPVADFRARLMRRLWDVKRNHDPARDAELTERPGCARVIVCGRGPDYLRSKCESLLALVKDHPDDSRISWG
jgi:hypothetical protein